MIKLSKMHKRVLRAHGAMLALTAMLPLGSAMAQTSRRSGTANASP